MPGGMDPSGLMSYLWCVFKCTEKQLAAGTTKPKAKKVCHNQCKHLRNIWNGAIEINQAAGVPTYILDFNEHMGTIVVPREPPRYIAPENLSYLQSKLYPNGWVEEPSIGDYVRAEKVRSGGKLGYINASGMTDFYNEGFHRMFRSCKNSSDPLTPLSKLVDQIANEEQWPETHRLEMGEEVVSETLAWLAATIATKKCVPRYEQLSDNTRNRQLPPLHNEEGSGQAFVGIAEADIPMSKELYYRSVRLLYGYEPDERIPWCADGRF